MCDITLPLSHDVFASVSRGHDFSPKSDPRTYYHPRKRNHCNVNAFLRTVLKTKNISRLEVARFVSKNLTDICRCARNDRLRKSFIDILDILRL